MGLACRRAAMHRFRTFCLGAFELAAERPKLLARVCTTPIFITPQNERDSSVQTMPLKKFLGLFLAGSGIAWYSQIKFSEGSSKAAPPPIALAGPFKASLSDNGFGDSTNGAANGDASDSAKLPEVAAPGGGVDSQYEVSTQGAWGRERSYGGQVASPRRGAARKA
jgi:hypothetical protein